MTGPRLTKSDLAAGDDQRDVAPDLDLVFGRRATRLGRGRAGAWREGSGRPGAPGPGEPFRPGRDLAARRAAFAAGAPSGSLGRVEAWDDDAPEPLPADDAESGVAWGARPRSRADGPATPRVAAPARPIVPGERRYRDGDRIRHARWGDGIVVTSRLTRSDEEVTVAFRDATVGRKTLLASLANLELVG
jgi:hypothetical protein